MSLDPTWFSSMYGFLFLVSQGYAAFALVILVMLALSQYQPIQSILRVTEQHDLGNLCLAFVMLNIYIAFSQYLIIWSGNLPLEIRWYMDRITGGWGPVAGLDFLFHWVLPFFLLLSRDIKRNKRKLATVCCIMLFARFWDTWWLIAPNFADERRQSSLSYRHAAIHFCARRDGRPVAGLLLHHVAHPRSGAAERSASAWNSGV